MRNTYLTLLVFCCFLSTAQANTLVIASDSSKGAEYYQQGKNLYNEGKYDEAVEAYKNARDAFGKENLKGYGLSTYKIGHVYDRIRQERKALPFYEEAVEAGNELLETQGDNDVLAKTLLMLGYVYYFFEDHPKTNKTLNRLLKLEFSDSLRTARSQTYCHNVLAGNYQKLGDYDSAMYHAKRALITSKPIGIDYIQAKGQAYNCNAELQYNLGNFESAQKFLDEQIALYQDAYGENHPYTIKPTMELGIIAYGASNYKRARDYFERAIWLAKNIGDSTSHDFATLVINASNLYTRTGDYAKSIEYMLVAIDIYEDKLPDIPDLYDGYAILAEQYARMGEVETSNMYAEKAVEFVDGNGDNLNFTHKILNKLTAAALANKDYKRSLDIGTKALSTGKELYGTAGTSIAAAYLRLASVNQYLGNGELSSQYIDSASLANIFDGNIRSQFIEVQIETQRLELINHQLLSNGAGIETAELEKLLAEFEEYVASIRKGINSEIGESFNINDYTAAAIELCYNLYVSNNDPQLIDFMFQLSERSKSLGLKDYLSKASFFNNASLGDQILSARKETVDELMILKKRIEDAKEEKEKNAELLTDYLTKQTNLTARYDSIIEVIALEHPNYYQYRYESERLNVPQLQTKLAREGYSFISYQLSGKNLFVLGNNGGSSFVKRVEWTDSLDVAVESVRKLLSDNGDTGLIDFWSKHLYQSIVKPVINEVTGSKLKIVTDGFLGYIPFEILQDEKGKFLFENFLVSYDYSAKTYLYNEGRPKGNSKILAFAPDFGLADNSTDVVRSSISALPGAEKEIKDLSGILDGKFMYGIEATESLFKQEALEYGILHMATHAIVDDEAPDNSRLILSVKGDSLNDGYLHAYEVYNLKLNASLATLSACNTGYGKVEKGEGVMSLSRAFAYAGVPATVVSLWPASDQSTPKLMKLFYANLDEGQPKDLALNNARKQYLKSTNGKGTHPFYWGAFVLIGDTSAMSSQWPNSLWFIVGSMVLIFIGYSMRRMVRK